MFRIELQRIVELLQRAVGLVRIVIADAEVRAGVHVLGIDLERVFVPLDGIRIPLGVEVRIAELDACHRVLGIGPDDVLEGLHTGLVEHRRLACLSSSIGLFLDGRLRPQRWPASLLGPDDPADDDAEQHAGHGECD